MHIKHRWIASDADLLNSKLNSHEKRYGHKCLYCKYESKSERDFLNHIGNDHEVFQEKGQFKCTQCKFVANNMNNLKSHKTSNHQVIIPKSILKNKMG